MPKKPAAVAPGAVQAPSWRNRIVGHGEADPATLVPHPENWRRHPATQRGAVQGALGELGWIQTVIVNQHTGHLVDGHLRVALALGHAEPLVPVTYVALSDGEERLALLTLNPLAALADADAGALQHLMALTTAQDAALHATLDALAIEHQLLPPLWSAESPPSHGRTAADTLETDDAADADRISMTPVPAPLSNVRMVQLFLTEETYPAFQRAVRALAPRYGVTTVTETVLECLTHAAVAVDEGK